MVSISDVATRARTSVTTVSRYLNEPERVKEETRSRIETAIDELGYARNSLARNFRMGSSRVILIVTSGAGDSFYREVINGVRMVADKEGYIVRIQEVTVDDPDDAGLAHIINSRQADGIIVMGHAGPLTRRTKQTVDAPSLPIVVCGETSDTELQVYPSFQIDGYKAGHQLVDFLARMGHRKIGFLGGAMPLLALTGREAGYRAAMEYHELPIEPVWVVNADLTALGARLAVAPFISFANRPTALICATDEMALGAMAELRSGGMIVPDDISVAGIDDIRYAALANPPLTTIAQPGMEIGRRGADCLFRMLAGNEVGRRPTFVAHQLVVRESVRSLAGVPT